MPLLLARRTLSPRLSASLGTMTTALTPRLTKYSICWFWTSTLLPEFWTITSAPKSFAVFRNTSQSRRQRSMASVSIEKPIESREALSASTLGLEWTALLFLQETSAAASAKRSAVNKSFFILRLRSPTFFACIRWASLRIFA